MVQYVRVYAHLGTKFVLTVRTICKMDLMVDQMVPLDSLECRMGRVGQLLEQRQWTDVIKKSL